jgi:hypothetical protein
VAPPTVLVPSPAGPAERLGNVESKNNRRVIVTKIKDFAIIEIF